ncbi:glycosyltransferase [Priestia megaterium]
MSKKVYLFDSLYSGHHLSYAKGIIENTVDTCLIVNQNKLHLFNDIPKERIIILKCKDLKSFKNPLLGIFFNLFNLYRVKGLKSNGVHFLYGDNLIELMYLLSTICKTNNYITIHWANAVVDIKKENGFLRSLYRKSKFFLFNKVSKKAKAIFVHGERTLKTVKDKYELKNIIEIPYGIEEDYNSTEIILPEKKKENVVLFFGGIRKDKGIEKLAELALKYNDVHFIVAGKPEDYSKDQIEKIFNNHSNVDLRLGFIEDEQVPILFNEADLLILPYEYYFSGQSGPLTLAAKYGVPVFATDVGDMGSDVKRFNLGIVVKDNSLNSLESGIRDFLNQTNDYKKNLQSYYERGTWRKVGTLIEREYFKSNKVED